ncbi:MAG TPA: hypothetical protein VFX15_15470 [Actinomycetes bacterium]|nr:hypothetical protein [Actinomycetes bacterium]
MSVQYARLVRHKLDNRQRRELQQVDQLAERLRTHLDEQAAAIDLVHVHGASSSVVQDIVADLLQHQLGFQSEVVITPVDGLVTRARPDFVYWLADGRGVLGEVERGGTTTNNHDLKDMWKAHISPDTQHLFLVVPQANWGEDGRAREKPFPRVVQRLSAFFGDERRELDVVSAHIFGYGQVDDVSATGSPEN